MLRARLAAAAAPVLATGARPTAWPMLYAALAGAASLFAFAPFGWWPLQLALLAFLFYQVGMDTSVRRAGLLGWAFGFGWSVAGMHWLYIAMNRFGDLPAPLAALAVALLAAYLGLFGALATGAASALRRRWSLPVNSFLLLVLPLAWGVSEWLRGSVFTGFPWAAAGYAHAASPLAGYAPLLGVYGVGALAAACASCRPSACCARCSRSASACARSSGHGRTARRSRCGSRKAMFRRARNSTPNTSSPRSRCTATWSRPRRPI
jgi:apolipoprotein N-acyltransferase